MARRSTAPTAPPTGPVLSRGDAARACAACNGPVTADARFCQWCGSPVTAAAPPGTGSRRGRQRAAVAVGGDRRPVSILFVDIVGSTALLGSMDPEDWRAIINEAFERLAPAVRRYDGTIGQYLGDGFLAFFGAPVAHEDDPARAALAALDLIEAARTYAADLRTRAGIDFAVRVGLDAGEVVAGEVGEGGEGGSAEYLVVGDAVNAAARLQSVAEPMTALASEGFAGSLRGRFVLEERGPFALKGLGPARRAIRVVAPVALDGSRAPLAGSALPLVGRARELDRLRGALETARAGRSTAVAIVGEAGIGKSRLLAEWRDLATRGGVRWAEAGAVTYGGGSTHHLVAALLRDLAGVDEVDGPQAFIDAVDAILGAADGPTRAAPAVSTGPSGGPGTAGMTGPTLAEIVWPGSQPNVPSEPRGLRLARRLALRELLDALTATTPLAIVLEDLHRADPASVSLLSSLIEPCASRLVVAVTSRPDPEASGWPMVEAIRALGAPDGTVVELGPLAPDDSTRMMEAILPGGPVPADVVTTVLRRAEGNPLFVEQLVRSLLDQGAVLRADGRWAATDRFDHDAIPSTIQGLLLARIDSLGPDERSAARIGAVIGRRFPGALLAEVGRLARLALPADLGPLADAGLIEPTSDDDGYAFRHALVQEAAYASLLRADRARLHGAVARALVAGRRDGLRALAPTLAFHYRRAGDLPRAIRFALMGGDEARSAHANSEALAAYDDVLAMLAELPAGSRQARRRTERAAHEGRGEILAWLQRREEALAANAAAMALLPRGPSLDRARLARERGIVLMTEQRVDDARAMYDIADGILGDRPPADRAARDEWVHLHLSRATLWYFTGDLEREAHELDLIGPWVEAEGSLEQRAAYLSDRNALALRRDRCRLSDEDADRERRALGIARQVGDPSLAAVFEFSLGLSLLLRDDLDEADGHLRDGLAAAEACQDELLVARIRAYRPMLALKRGDLEACRTLTDEAYEAVSSLGLQEYVALTVAYRAWVAWRDGRSGVARTLAQDAVTTWDGLPFSYPFRWVALLPVMALDLEEGDVASALQRAHDVLRPDQQRLPDALEAALGSALEAFDANESGASMKALGHALERARSCGYL